MLPIDDSGNPDFAYMESYASCTREVMLRRYREFAGQQLSQLEYKMVPSLNEKEWAPFSIVGLFDLIVPGRGKGLNHLFKMRKGGVNYVGATNRNNGVLCYVREDDSSRPMILDGNCIGFIKNGDGSAGFAIYKAEQFISTSDVLYGYADWLNVFTGLFFVAAQDKIEHKYSHGYKRKCSPTCFIVAGCRASSHAWDGLGPARPGAGGRRPPYAAGRGGSTPGSSRRPGPWWRRAHDASTSRRTRPRRTAASPSTGRGTSRWPRT